MRKIAMVAKQVKMEDEDIRDVKFWLSRPVSERLAEVTRLKRAYYLWVNGSYPQHIEKVITTREL